MKFTESKIQQSCVRWFRYNFPQVLIAAIPNGGRVGMNKGAILKAEGTLRGMPDTVILRASGEYHALFVEFKTDKGTVRPEQKIIHEKLRDELYKVEVCRSFDEFRLIVEKYFDL